MERHVDEKRLRTLLAEGKSQREMAQTLKIPRTSLQRVLKSLDTPAPPPTHSTSSTAPPAPILSMSFAGSPVADALPLTPAELDAVRADFWEMMEWWRDRKLKRIHKSVPRDLQRQTYHVERRYIELIREEAEADGVSITEVVNRALRAYFERRKNGAAP